MFIFISSYSEVQCSMFIFIEVVSNLGLLLSTRGPASHSVDLDLLLGISANAIVAGTLNSKHLSWNNHVNNAASLKLFR